MPYNYLTVLPFVVIYDIVFAVSGFLIFTIITFGLIVLFYIGKQFIRR